MSLLSIASSAANPYLLYIKLALIALAIATVVGTGLYIKHVFTERQQLVADKAKLEMQVQLEQQKVIAVTEQIKVWQNTVEKINNAMKNIKVESNTYIEGTENAKPPVVPNGTIIPFVMSGMSPNTTLPRLETFSSSRKRTVTP